jgi:hypothetical protein
VRIRGGSAVTLPFFARVKGCWVKSGHSTTSTLTSSNSLRRPLFKTANGKVNNEGRGVTRTNLSPVPPMGACLGASSRWTECRSLQTWCCCEDIFWYYITTLSTLQLILITHITLN